ncbi:hypothetical protein OKZ62_003815 [Vibrio navarrensis]|uniref:Uncharacterized protein n=1 Tax=Vibrio navarrensis TaxID=29495 RepID=A0AAI9CR91_9VIBR|nr:MULTISPECIES: hypothetical protein [Vibrio]EJL6393038.1 hypothetical protein [Vibrio navarrensis]EKA5637861.1 hypothetical protein [Vibrio navarrensis]ELN6930774.1 hypothetical protein [Vibrio navarrensis]
MKRFMPSSVMLTPFVVRVYPENEQEEEGEATSPSVSHQEADPAPQSGVE